MNKEIFPKGKGNACLRSTAVVFIQLHCEPLHSEQLPIRGQHVIHCDFEGFCFSFYQQSSSSRRSETVLNSHQKSGCACSPMTFSILFVCVSLCPSCVSMASPSAGRSHSTPTSCRPPPIPPPYTRNACLR